MTEVQPLAWKIVSVSLKASLYFNPQGGQCFAGVAQYQDPQALDRTKQIVLSGKFLDANPPVHGDTVVELESVDAGMHINLLDPLIVYGELTIIGTTLQVILYELPDLGETDNRLVHAIIFGNIRPVNSEFIIDKVRSTQPLSVSLSS